MQPDGNDDAFGKRVLEVSCLAPLSPASLTLSCARASLVLFPLRGACLAPLIKMVSPQQSSVFQRLYEVAQRRQERLSQKREEVERVRLEEERKITGESSHLVNRRSMALVAHKRGTQDIFTRLHDEARKAELRREEMRERVKSAEDKAVFGERESRFVKGQKIEPFQPDIGPKAKALERDGTMFDHLDAEGRKKRQEQQQREELRRARMLQGAPPRPDARNPNPRPCACGPAR